MSQCLLLLGRQPALGLAELESLYGAARLHPVAAGAVLVDIDPADLDFNRLGGTVKAAALLATLETTEWRTIEAKLPHLAVELAATEPEGKLTIGVSTYGYKVTPGQLTAAGLQIKKALRKHTERPVRLVPNQEPALSSAQVYHNHLADTNGMEFDVLHSGERTLIARTIAVQAITSYTLRDRGRPKRDARVGMLPPKLAQIITNLTAAMPGSTILDPFCGTGVLLQEALLMDYEVYGTDVEPRMVEYSRQNLDWLSAKFHLATPQIRLETADATNHTWQPPVDAVACETYLGKPFTAAPAPAVLKQTMSDCNLIIKKFLASIHHQLPTGARLCIAVPAWQTRPAQFEHLPLIDQIRQMGYNRVRFEHVRDDQLLYYREDQIVARQLLVLTKE